MVRLVLTCILASYCSLSGFAQTDQQKIKKWVDDFEAYEFEDSLRAKKYLQQAFELAKKIDDKKWLGKIYRCRAWYEVDQGNFKRGIVELNKSIASYKAVNDIQGIADSYGNLGIIYEDLSNYYQSLHHQQTALKLYDYILKFEKDSSRLKLARSGKNYALGNLGNTFFSIGDNQKALDYLKQSLELERETNDSLSICISLENIGINYRSQKKYDTALSYYQEAMRYCPKKDRRQINPSLYLNFSHVYNDMGDRVNGKKYLDSALVASQIIQDHRNMSFVYQSLALYYLKSGEINKAIEAVQIGLRETAILGSADRTMYLHHAAFRIYRAANKLETALFHLDRYDKIKDSLFDKDKTREFTKLELNYEFEKEKLADSLTHQQEKSAQDKKLAEKNIQLEKEKSNRYILIVVLLTIIALALSVLWSLRNKKRANLLLQEKNEKIHLQKEILEEQQKEIVDSINYAKKIQEALLHSPDELKQVWNESFVLFLPRDIVSGDFYWVEKLDDGSIIFAVADCTGHGVPGGFMSMLGANMLNEIILEQDVYETDQILNLLRNKIIQVLKQKDSAGTNKDGMDISLVRFFPNENRIQFSGANNSIYVFKRNPSPHKFIETVPDKMPIGYHSVMQAFRSEQISVEQGDFVYLFSDGFADQFGGKKGKKLKYKYFEQLLGEICHLNGADQQKKLKQFIKDWRGDLEQNDDICILGFRV